MVELSVVIPTFQRCESLRHVLLACTRQSLPAGRFEIIVAIDGSIDETAAMLQQIHVPYPLRWTAVAHSGPGSARNAGATLARGNVLLFLDDDIIPTPRLLQEHLLAHQDVASLVCLGQVRLWPQCQLSPWEKYLNQHFEEQYDKLSTPGYRPTFWDCLSGNVSLHRSLMAQVQGFNPKFNLTRHEDIELGYRLARQGGRFIYRPQALGYHRFIKDTAAGLRDAWTNGASALRLAHLYPELKPQLIAARWQRYPPAARYFMQWTFASPQRHARLSRLCRHALFRAQSVPLPGALRRPLHRLAYHLHFWQGVLSEAQPGEYLSLLDNGSTHPGTASNSSSSPFT